MAILSLLQRSNFNLLRASVVSFQKRIYQITVKNNVIQVPFRNMASDHHHPKIFNITPSRFQYTKMKDDLHFYAFLGIVPLSIVVFCANVFIGPAELAEIPEGYEPKEWEYHKHPVKRFFVRYFKPCEQQEYEKYMHFLNEEIERMDWKLKVAKAKRLMAERNDYIGPFYIPSRVGKDVRRSRFEADRMDERMGFK